MSSFEDLKKIRQQIDLLIQQEENERKEIQKKKDLDELINDSLKIFNSNKDKFFTLFEKLPYLSQVKVASQVPYFDHSLHLKIAANHLGINLPVEEIKQNSIDYLLNSMENGEKDIDPDLIQLHWSSPHVFHQAIKSEYFPYFDVVTPSSHNWGSPSEIAEILISASDEMIKKVHQCQKTSDCPIYWNHFICSINLNDRKDIVVYLLNDGVFSLNIEKILHGGSKMEKLLKEIYSL